MSALTLGAAAIDPEGMGSAPAAQWSKSIEVITHLAFYSGWPKPMSAIGVAKETFGK